MIVRWLDALRFDSLVHACAALLGTLGVAMLVGLAARRRGLVEAGLLFLLLTTTATALDTFLIVVVEPDVFASPPGPGWLRAPLVGLGVLATAGLVGARADRRRPWAEVWLAAVVAGGLASGVVAWRQLDRLVVDLGAGLPRPTPLVPSSMDSSSPPLWTLALVAGALGAATLPQALGGASSRALRVTADVFTVAAVLLAPAALVRGFTAPQLEGYVASLPVVAKVGWDSEAGAGELGLRCSQYPPIPWLDLYKVVDGTPTGFRWRWNAFAGATRTGSGVVQGVTRLRAGEGAYDLRYDGTSDVWLLVTHDDRLEPHAVEWLRKPADEPAAYEGPRWEDHLPLDRVAGSVAPPWSWTSSAAFSAAGSLLLRATRFATEPSRGTIAAMRLAVLAAGVTPLAVAAWRGFVLPW